MKNIRNIIAAVVLLALPATTSAQDILTKAFDNFVNDKTVSEYIRRSTTLDKEQDGSNKYSFCYTYDFNMPSDMDRKLKPIREAFHKEADNAYSVMMKNAGTNTSETVTIGYGNRLQRQVEFGAHKNRNYMVELIRDEKDSLRRHCYALVWYKDVDNDRVCGSLWRIYSRDPAQQPPKKRITNSTDFLQMFGNLRMAYINTLTENGTTNRNISLTQLGNVPKDKREETTQKAILLTGVANEIHRLCKDKGFLLSKSEKTLCTESLKEMQQLTSDSYISGLLNEAAMRLKKW